MCVVVKGLAAMYFWFNIIRIVQFRFSVFMNLTKNKVFCIGCKRTKMLFAEEQNALNFIKFKSESILEETGRAPARA